MTFKDRIEALPDVETYATDDVIPELYCRRLHNNKRSFYVRFKVAGKWRKICIGRYPTLGVEEARTIAKRYVYAAALGRNPAEERRQQRAMPNLDALFESAATHHWGVRTSIDWKKKVVEIYNRDIKPVFGHRVVTEITSAEIRRWHLNFLVEDRKVLGNRALAVMSRLFGFADEMGYVTPGYNPTLIVKYHRERARERRASKEELARVVQAIENRRNKYPDAYRYLITLAFTGARPSAIYKSKLKDVTTIRRNGEEWGHLVHEGKSTSKTGAMETVLIPPRIWKILREGRNPEDSLTGVTRMTQTDAIWREILKHAGVEGLWMRDLRRTFASIGLSQGVSIGVIGEILNHQSAQTTKIYARLNGEERLDAMAEIVQTLESNGVKVS